MFFKEHELMVEKRWSELFSIMTEDENKHVRASEEKELNVMWVEEFFVKLLVFKERILKSLEPKGNGKTNP